MTTKMFEPWAPTVPEIELDLAGVLSEVDPRVETNHVAGQMPVPPNPPPPEGWVYWKNQTVPGDLGKFANTMLHDPGTFPMGSFVRIKSCGAVVGLRVEWHNYQGSTGKKGCFRGVNLLRKTGDAG